MDFNQLIDDITPEIYRNLKLAVEIGKWPDGRVLSAEQRALSMQAVIAFEARHLHERERTGFIDRGKKQQGELCDDLPPDSAAEQTIKWRQ